MNTSREYHLGTNRRVVVDKTVLDDGHVVYDIEIYDGTKCTAAVVIDLVELDELIEALEDIRDAEVRP